MIKRICFVSCVGDIGDTHTLKYINTLLENGFTAESIRTGKNPQQNFKHTRLPDIGSNFWPSGNSIFNIISAIIQRLRNCIILANRIIKTKPNVIVATEPDSWLVAVLCKYFLKNRIVADIREVYEDRIAGFPKVFKPLGLYLTKSLMSFCSKHTDEIIHVSEERQKVYRYLNIPGKVVIYYPNLYKEVSKNDAGNSGEFIVVHAGALRAKYGASQIIDAFSLLSLKHQKIILYVLGGTAGPIENKEQLKSLVSKGTIKIIEQVPYSTVLDFLGKSKVGLNIVLPVDESHYLAQPRKLYEYLSMGLPFVAAKVPTIENVAKRWGNGITVDPYSHEEIAKALEFYYLNEDARLEASVSALKSHVEEFNWERQIPNYISIFSKLTT